MGTPEGRLTPLYPFHLQHGAKFVDFAGWKMPIQYSSILEEHKATRSAAGLFDVSHMGEFLISGTNAISELNRLITNDLNKVKVGQALYSPICMENGGVIDDLILYRKEDDSIFICCNAANVEKVEQWFTSNLEHTSCEVENLSSRYAQIAIQGPLAIGIIDQLLPNASKSIKRFHFKETNFLGGEVILSRTGYTGEDGYEIYCAPQYAQKIADILMDTGKPHGLVPVGLGARDSLRLEAGYPLYGHEISETISPIEGGLSWTVKFNKSETFIGKSVLIEQKSSPSTRKTVHFITEDKRIAREGTEILANGEKVGTILSGSYSPILNRGIGSAIVSGNYSMEIPLTALIRNKPLMLIPSSTPLHLHQ